MASNDDLDVDSDFTEDLTGDYFGPEVTEESDGEGDFKAPPPVEEDYDDEFKQKKPDPKKAANYSGRFHRLLSAEEYFDRNPLPSGKRSKSEVQVVLQFIRGLQAQHISDKRILQQFSQFFGCSPRQSQRYMRRIRQENEQKVAFRQAMTFAEIEIIEKLNENYENLHRLAFDSETRPWDRVRALRLMAQAGINRYYVCLEGIDGIGKEQEISELTPREIRRIANLLLKRYGKHLLQVQIPTITDPV